MRAEASSGSMYKKCSEELIEISVPAERRSAVATEREPEIGSAKCQVRKLPRGRNAEPERNASERDAEVSECRKRRRRGGRSDGLGFSVVRCAHLSCVPWISELVRDRGYLPFRRVRGGRPEGFRPEAGRKTQRRETSQELRDVKSRSAEDEFGQKYKR